MTQLRQRCLEKIQTHQLFCNKDKVVVGVSGGIDSMVLMHILHSLEIPMIVAHVNYQKRGNASDLDEILVQEYAQKLGIPFYAKRFDVVAKKGASFQSEARKFRYQFFNELKRNYGCRAIAIGHHADDYLESCLIHWIRGGDFDPAGVMSFADNEVIRPLFWFSRADIEKYALEVGVPWREDESNYEDVYLRNRIRHHLVPEILKINPGLIIMLVQKAEMSNEKSKWQNVQIVKYWTGKLNRQENGFEIQTNLLKKEEGWPYLLDFLLEKINMGYATRHQVVLSLRKPEGQLFYWKNLKLRVSKKNITISTASHGEDYDALEQSLREFISPSSGITSE